MFEPENDEPNWAISMRASAQQNTPEGFRLLGWLHDGKFYERPLWAPSAFPIYCDQSDGDADGR